MAVIYLVLVFAVFVNGATDAANSICGAVATKAMSYKKATALSAAMNFLGLFIFALFFPSVSNTVMNMTSGGVREAGIVLFSVALYSFVMWLFSIPTSESHALTSAILGVSSATVGELDLSAFLYIYLALILSALSGFVFGAISNLLFGKRKVVNKKTAVVGMLLSSFFHGAQDGQKFLAVAIGFGLCSSGILPILLVGIVLFVGTLSGGVKMVEKLTSKITDVDIKTAVSSDIGSAAALSLITFLGVAGGTTYTKTMALVGAAAAGGKRINIRELLSVVFGWIFTVPICYILSYYTVLITKIFM